jgi:hypothetical protein
LIRSHNPPDFPSFQKAVPPIHKFMTTTLFCRSKKLSIAVNVQQKAKLFFVKFLIKTFLRPDFFAPPFYVGLEYQKLLFVMRWYKLHKQPSRKKVQWLITKSFFHWG